LALALTFELFEPIAGRNTQVVKRFRSIENQEFSQRGALDILRDTFDAIASKDVFRLPFAKAPNHANQRNATR
jgi:hypothetical protein